MVKLAAFSLALTVALYTESMEALVGELEGTLEAALEVAQDVANGVPVAQEVASAIASAVTLAVLHHRRTRCLVTQRGLERESTRRH